MALFVVATPIGNLKDISQRAIETLQFCEVIVGEERKELSKRLKLWGISGKTFELLNEHTKIEELRFLSELCKTKNVALMSDCGTPSFCDPGFQLVKECRKLNIPIQTLPGASSLMSLLSMSSQKISTFYFAGFLPANNEIRPQAFSKLSKNNETIILMDTPYRFQKTLKDVIQHFSNRTILIGTNMTQENESFIECAVKNLDPSKLPEKAEFVILIYSKPI